MSIEVIVPYLEGCAHRQAALQWVMPRYRWPLRLAYGEEPWCKAQAVMPALERSRASIVIVADADVWTDGLSEALRAVQDGAPWAIPHRNVHRLTKEGTQAVYGGASWLKQSLEQRPYQGMAGGGYVIAPREALLSVPLDSRFVGWGQEDQSWGYALTSILGTPFRGGSPLAHLWHPPQPRLSRRWGTLEGKKLVRRYHLARRDPQALRRLLSEI